MPCDSGMGHVDYDSDAHRKIDALKKECNDVTRMLCSIIRLLDTSVHLPPDIVEWYRKHQEHDKSQGR